MDNACRFLFVSVALLAASHARAAKHSDIRWEPLYEPGGGGAIVSLGISPHDPGHVLSGGDMLGLGVSFDGGESWRPANKGLTSYEMATPTFHPKRANEVWTGSCMGLFKSTDGGRSWTPSRNGMPEMSGGRYSMFIEKVLFDPADDRHLIAFGGSSRRWWPQADSFGAVWHSTDGGDSWTRTGTITTNGFVTTVEKGANIVKAFWGPTRKKNVVALHLMADHAGWFVSVDRGKTWRRRSPKGLESPLANFACHPTDSSVFWAVTKAGAKDDGGKFAPGRICKSTDGGRTFSPSDEGVRFERNANVNLTTRFRDIAVSPVDPNVLYASDASWSSSSIWGSTDGGATWRCLCAKWMDGFRTACYAGPACIVVPSPHAADCAYAFNSEYILRTADGGKTWIDMTARRPDPSKPDHWRGRGWNGWCSRKYVFNPHRRGESMMLAMDAGHGWHSTDGLKSWRYALGHAGPWLGANDAAFSKDGCIYIATGQRGANSGVMVSADGGGTWINRHDDACGLPSRDAGVYDFAWVDPDNGRSAFVIMNGARYVTTDGGATWRSETVPGGTGELAADPTTKGRFYLKTGAGVRVTEDWKTFRNLGLEGWAEGSLVCDAKGRVLVCRGRVAREKTGLWRYDPQDGSWTQLHADRLASAVAVDPTDPRRIVFLTSDMPYHDYAGAHGIFISDDDGATWAACDMGGMMRRFSCAAFDPFDPETIVVGQGGGGFIRGTWKKRK